MKMPCSNCVIISNSTVRSLTIKKVSDWSVRASRHSGLLSWKKDASNN